MDYNSVVAKGQLLAEIDPSLLEANIRAVSRPVCSPPPLRSRRPRANLAEAKKNLERNRDLFERLYRGHGTRPVQDGLRDLPLAA